ncbi:MAG TPA: hypothetical protein VIJ94_20700 [Caulobacteraceae bacterium]
MQDLDRALADISEIRSQLARGSAFHGYGAATLAATGVFAALAAIVQAALIPDPAHNPLAYVGLWTATAAISVIVIGLETVTRSRREHSGMAQEMIVSAAEQFLPAGLAGVLLTAVLLRFEPEALWMLPGLWQVVFALGVFASCRFLPRPMLLVGGWYLAAAMASLVVARGSHAFSPWAMGAPFAAGQLMVGAVLQLSSRGV